LNTSVVLFFKAVGERFDTLSHSSTIITSLLNVEHQSECYKHSLTLGDAGTKLLETRNKNKPAPREGA
jgi:hypothetical protein